MKCNLLTQHVLSWMQNGRPARILHLFAEVCNLVDADGAVISLVTPTIGPGPFAMVIEGDLRGRLAQVDLQYPIVIDPARQGLSVGPLSIETHDASLWNSKPCWSLLRSEVGSTWPEAAPLPEAIESALDKLLEAIGSGNIPTATATVTTLAGLGTGLTPAGDDVLLGIVYALWIWLPLTAWIDLIVETAAPRTTTLSAAFLLAARTGEASIHWHDLVNKIPDAPEKILAIGHSSGSDAWAGFLRAKEAFSKGI